MNKDKHGAIFLTQNIGVPLGVLSFVYLMAISFRVENPFFNIFAGGDLVIFSVLISIFLIDFITQERRYKPYSFDAILHAFYKKSPIVFIIAYVVLKCMMLNFSYFVETKVYAIYMMSFISIFCFCATIFFLYKFKDHEKV